MRIEEAVHVELAVLVMDAQNALDYVTRALTLSSRALLDIATHHQQETVKTVRLLRRGSDWAVAPALSNARNQQSESISRTVSLCRNRSTLLGWLLCYSGAYLVPGQNVFRHALVLRHSLRLYGLIQSNNILGQCEPRARLTCN